MLDIRICTPPLNSDVLNYYHSLCILICMETKCAETVYLARCFILYTDTDKMYLVQYYIQ